MGAARGAQRVNRAHPYRGKRRAGRWLIEADGALGVALGAVVFGYSFVLEIGTLGSLFSLRLSTFLFLDFQKRIGLSLLEVSLSLRLVRLLCGIHLLCDGGVNTHDRRAAACNKRLTADERRARRGRRRARRDQSEAGCRRDPIRIYVWLSLSRTKKAK